MKAITLGLVLHVVGASFFTVALAQAPSSPNTDIVKMIQAGLPESTVVNKIREGAGRWDTSVDGLILLKHAGATEAELGALTSKPESTGSVSQELQRAPVEVFGATLVRTRTGNP